ILAADLSSFVLDLAAWGAAPETLSFLDPPPKGALAEARALLTELGALADGRITEEGHALRRLPLPPRLARMVVDAAREGAGALVALAYPERIAKNRGNGAFTLANGRGGNIDQASPLTREPFIAVAELTGGAANARIALAAPVRLEEIEVQFADRIDDGDEVS